MDKIFYCAVRYAGTITHEYKFICANSIEEVFKRFFYRGVHSLIIEDITDIPITEFEENVYVGIYSV